MRRSLALGAGMMLAASTAMAQGVNGLHMAWVSCPNSPGSTPYAEMSCDPTSGDVYRLHATFSLAQPVPGVVALDGFLDFRFDSPAHDVPPFWQFQQGGCNQAGVTISATRPTSRCGIATNTSQLCGPDGSGCGAVITGYGFGSSINFPPDRARMLLTLYRPSSNPINLSASSSPTAAHFAFELDFSMDGAEGGPEPGCQGCYTGFDVIWNWGVLYNTLSPNRPEGVAASLSSADPGSGNAGVVANQNAVVPVKVATWGRLKSLYR